MKISQLINWLDRMYPPYLADSWDNTGLLIGDSEREVRKVMSCLGICEQTVIEAVESQVDLIIAHHPFPFHAIKRLRTDETDGRFAWELIGARISLYSPHTAHDSAAYGINWQLSERLGLQDTVPLVFAAPENSHDISAANTTDNEMPPVGQGRIGRFPETIPLSEVLRMCKEMLGIANIQYVGDLEMPIRTLAIGCGAAETFLPLAHQQGAEALLLGEARFHTCLEAESLGMALIIPGHYASERFALDQMAEYIKATFPELEVFASHREYDPVKFG